MPRVQKTFVRNLVVNTENRKTSRCKQNSKFFPLTKLITLATNQLYLIQSSVIWCLSLFSLHINLEIKDRKRSGQFLNSKNADSLETRMLIRSGCQQY